MDHGDRLQNARMTLSDLSGPLLSRYLQVMYGDRRSSARPEDLHMLWADMIGLNASRSLFNVACADMHPGVLHNNRCGFQREWDSPSMLFVAQPRGQENRVVRSDSWVEVTHCSEARKLRIKKAQHTAAWCRRGGRAWCFEESSTWMYITPGSGMMYNVGRTIAFATPQAAVMELLGKESCEDASCRGRPLELLYAKLRQAGYRSLQFYHYEDQRCNMTSVNLIDLHRRGLNKDPCEGQTFRTSSHGWCNCVSDDGCARCLPHGAVVANQSTPSCTICPRTHSLQVQDIFAHREPMT